MKKLFYTLVFAILLFVNANGVKALDCGPYYVKDLGANVTVRTFQTHTGYNTTYDIKYDGSKFSAASDDFGISSDKYDYLAQKGNNIFTRLPVLIYKGDFILNNDGSCPSYLGVTKGSIRSIEVGNYLDTYTFTTVVNLSNNDLGSLYVQLVYPLQAAHKELMHEKVIVGDQSFSFETIKDNALQSTDEATKELLDRVCNEAESKKNPKTCLIRAVRRVYKYCENNVGTSECDSFYQLLEKMPEVELDKLEYYNFECNIMSNEFVDKLKWVLNIFKIAAPIIALALGTIDFIKAMVSDDADKEMQTAAKHFRTRIIAAVLLFLVPYMVVFMLDIFLKNKDGYDSDNPYCNIVDWENK